MPDNCERKTLLNVVDPAKVTRSALQNTASVAALFLTTEAVYIKYNPKTTSYK
ncbi:hypothetical protein [Psychrobacillus psychrodurans]|uniref:hypothetical protein n=1 Tax=Psychrobacillus psychrodurans TaxID=126157 RepID=UPI003D079ECF